MTDPIRPRAAGKAPLEPGDQSSYPASERTASAPRGLKRRFG
jgi:hypothetical protein